MAIWAGFYTIGVAQSNHRGTGHVASCPAPLLAVPIQALRLNILAGYPTELGYFALDVDQKRIPLVGRSYRLDVSLSEGAAVKSGHWEAINLK